MAFLESRLTRLNNEIARKFPVPAIFQLPALLIPIVVVVVYAFGHAKSAGLSDLPLINDPGCIYHDPFVGSNCLTKTQKEAIINIEIVCGIVIALTLAVFIFAAKYDSRRKAKGVAALINLLDEFNREDMAVGWHWSNLTRSEALAVSTMGDQIKRIMHDPNLLETRVRKLNSEIGPIFPKTSVIQVFLMLAPPIAAAIYSYLQLTSDAYITPPPSEGPLCMYYDQSTSVTSYGACPTMAQTDIMNRVKSSGIGAAVAIIVVAFLFWMIARKKRLAGEQALKVTLEEFNSQDAIVGLYWTYDMEIETTGWGNGRTRHKRYVGSLVIYMFLPWQHTLFRSLYF
ncbi:UNVERIFIED_CONTAM: hypothetical protein HDU68_001980 [Siphonaria sp. JEL0065]|nr:hypothetical protein HDU68_001980 [Siphonaria sp. JEL0065]